MGGPAAPRGRSGGHRPVAGRVRRGRCASGCRRRCVPEPEEIVPTGVADHEQQDPFRPGGGDEVDGVLPADPADGFGGGVRAGLVGADRVHEPDPEGPGQVEAEGLRPLRRAALVPAADEVLQEVPPDPVLGFQHAGQPGQLHRQHGGAVLQGQPLELARGLVGVDQRQETDDVVAGAASTTMRSPIRVGFRFRSRALTVWSRSSRSGALPLAARPGPTPAGCRTCPRWPPGSR